MVQGDEVLVLRRHDPPELRLPKGHIDPGEDAQAAAVREVLEESGWHCAIDRGLAPAMVEFDHDGRHIQRLEHYFVMRPIERRHDGEDQFETEWLPLAVAAETLTFEAERRRVTEALLGGRAT